MRAAVVLLTIVLIAAHANAMPLSRVQSNECEGTCQKVSKSCAFDYVQGLCPGNRNIQCCPSKAPDVVVPTEKSPCEQQGGQCLKESAVSCNGGWVKGLCPDQPADVKCCKSGVSTTGQAGTGQQAPSAAHNFDGLRSIKFSDLWKAYKSGGESAEEVIANVFKREMKHITNTCVVRTSWALNKAGLPVQSFTLANGKNMYIERGADKMRYALRVKEFKEYVVKKYGNPTLIHRNSGDGGDVPEKFRGKNGLVMFDVRCWTDATGHFDLWQGIPLPGEPQEGQCGHACYFDKAREIWLWQMRD